MLCESYLIAQLTIQNIHTKKQTKKTGGAQTETAHVSPFSTVFIEQIFVSLGEVALKNSKGFAFL